LQSSVARNRVAIWAIVRVIKLSQKLKDKKFFEKEEKSEKLLFFNLGRKRNPVVIKISRQKGDLK